MTRVASIAVERFRPGDIVWADGHGRRVAHIERLEPRTERGERWRTTVVFFTDGTHASYDRGYTCVQVVIPAFRHNDRRDGILEHR
jgi:hypothetical protein